MLDNWLTFGKALAISHQVYLIDQRNHGNSPHTQDHSYALMADDVYAFCMEHHLEQITLIGHSMGGKTAMYLACEHPELVQTLMVIDMGVKHYNGGHEAIFRALRSLDLTAIQSRKEAEDFLSEAIAEPGVRQFLLKNLSRDTSGTYRWKFNLQALFHHYAETLREVPPTFSYTGQTIFIRGGNSGYISDSDWDGIQVIFPKAQLFTVPGAGHWVHADQPALLLDTIVAHI
jgi:pimeloyl-ACP methyl ester carboxylesterase